MPERSNFADTVTPAAGKRSITADITRFQRQFDIFTSAACLCVFPSRDHARTGGLLKGIDLREIGAFVGGGSVLNCLLPIPAEIDALHDRSVCCFGDCCEITIHFRVTEMERTIPRIALPRVLNRYVSVCVR